MQTRAFERFLKHLSELTARQRERLLALLLSARQTERVLALIEHTDNGVLACPRCGGHKSYRHGHANVLQRSRCRNCGRTFNALSGTPLARLRLKAHWFDYLDRMLDSASVRRCATELGVATTTTFRWRHRFLARTKDDRPAQLGGIAEADEMYVLEGEHTGRNPTDRGKLESQHHLLVDERGLPPVVQISGAQVRDSRFLIPLVESIPAVKWLAGRARKHPGKLHADRSYASRAHRAWLRSRGIAARIARYGVESRERPGR